jgi:hypothetical protein
MLDWNGRVINEPLLVVYERIMTVGDARERLDAITDRLRI